MLRRCLWAVCAVVVAFSVLLSPSSVAATDGDEIRVVRHFGDDRYATAIVSAVSLQQQSKLGSPTAVLVAGDRWPEAALAVPLAAAVGGSLLLTPPHELRTDIVVHLLESNVEHAIIVTSSGERETIKPAVIERLRDLGIGTTVIGGEDRHATGVAVARHFADIGEAPSTVVLANGEVFADALSGGQIAAQGPYPVLLSPARSLPASVSGYLVDARVERVILMGGEAALSPEIEISLRRAGIETLRIAGGDRYQTAAAAASVALSSYREAGCYARQVGLARADKPIDSFSASRLSNAMCMPVLLASPDRIPESTVDALDRMFAEQPSSGDPIAELHVFGGEAAIHRAAIDAYLSRDGIDLRCKPRGHTWEVTAGFPLPSWAADSTGVLRVAMLFMDFPDAPAHRTTQAEFDLGASFMERYLENASYGKLDVEIVAHHEWLRADRDHSTYLSDLARGVRLAYHAGAHAVSLADPDFDFSDMDVVQVVFTSDHFSGGGNANGSVTVDGNTLLVSRINHRPASSPVSGNWGMTAAHEIAHNMGIADLYPYDRELHPIPDVRRGHRLVKAEFGLMGLRVRYVTPEDDTHRRVVWRWPNGESFSGHQWSFDAPEMLAWSRYQLGWLDDHQIHCVTAPSTTVALHPIALPANGTAMIVLSANEHEVVVIESRRKIGGDQDFVVQDDDNGSAVHQRIAHEGVLVYAVSTLTKTGTLPIKVIGDSGDGQVPDFPLVAAGDSVSVGGFEVKVAADTGSHHLVRIRRAN